MRGVMEVLSSIVKVTKDKSLDRLEKVEMFIPIIDVLSNEELDSLVEESKQFLLVVEYEELVASVNYLTRKRSKENLKKRKEAIGEGFRTIWRGIRGV